MLQSPNQLVGHGKSTPAPAARPIDTYRPEWLGAVWGIVTACNATTGLATVAIAEAGTIGSLTATARTISAWIGIDSEIRIDDEVMLLRNDPRYSPTYTAHKHISGIIYEEPTVGELATEQDDPDEVTDCGASA